MRIFSPGSLDGREDGTLLGLSSTVDTWSLTPKWSVADTVAELESEWSQILTFFIWSQQILDGSNRIKQLSSDSPDSVRVRDWPNSVVRGVECHRCYYLNSSSDTELFGQLRLTHSGTSGLSRLLTLLLKVLHVIDTSLLQIRILQVPNSCTSVFKNVGVSLRDLTVLPVDTDYCDISFSLGPLTVRNRWTYFGTDFGMKLEKVMDSVI